MQELADIILEVDSITFWNRKSGRKQFLTSCNVAGAYKKHKGFEKDAKTIIRAVCDLDVKSKINERNLEKLSHTVNRYSSKNVGNKNDGAIELILGIKTDFRSFRSEIQAELKQLKHDIASVKSELKEKK
jgi:hypothetical protein